MCTKYYKLYLSVLPVDVEVCKDEVEDGDEEEWEGESCGVEEDQMDLFIVQFCDDQVRLLL